MPENTALAPTDAEIAAIADQHKASGHGTVWPHAFARAVLAKWGTPPAVAGEPVAIYHGRCTIDCGEHGHLDMELLKMIPAGSKLYTAPQPAQALKPIQWSDEREPNDDVSYHHVIAESPLGRITVEWKGWKKHDSHCVYVGGEYIDSGSTLEDAKKIAECHLQNVVEALTTAAPADAAVLRDAAIGMLADWVHAVNTNGTGWDDWDEHFKDAAFRPGPLRELLDEAIAARAAQKGNHD